MRRRIKSCCFPSRPEGVRRWAALALALLLLSGCGGEKSEDSSLRLGVALYSQDDTFISIMAKDLEQLVQEEESRIGQKITLLVSDSRHNQTTQMGQVDLFLARGCASIWWTGQGRR